MRQHKPKSLFGVPAMILCSIVGCLNAGWWQTFGGTERDEGTCVQQTSDSGYIISGVTWSFGAEGNPDIWLIKVDSLGDTEWTKTYGEGGGGYVWQTSDGGYFCSGSKLIRMDQNGEVLWTREWAGYIRPTSDGGLIHETQSNGILLIKLDENGDSVWAKHYKRGNAGTGCKDIQQTSDGGYIISGVAIDTLNEDVYKASIWLLKTDENGDTLWTKTYGGEEWNEDDRGNCVRQTSDGGYIIGGLLDDPVNRWYCLIKTDSAGNIEWKSIEDGELYCVEQTDDGGYIAVGATETATLASSATPTGGNLWLIKTDENGDTVWTRKYGGDETDAGRYMQQTTDSGYIVTGYTRSFSLGRSDVYLLKTDSLGLLFIEEEPIVESVSNWRLLSSIGSEIKLQYWDRPTGLKASIYDVSGRQVGLICGDGNEGVMTWGINQPPGVYFIQVNEQNSTSTTKVVLVR